jgi:hypothetical protein
MSEQRVLFLQKSLIGTCALVALVLLFSFYGVVSEAVHRAARQRLASADAVPQATAPAAQRNAPRKNALLARIGN